MGSADATTMAYIQTLLAKGYTLDQIPAAKAPDGQHNDLVNPLSRAYMITICNIVCLIVVLAVVGLRIFTRTRLVRSVGYDDYCTIFALFCFLGETALFQYATRWGAGVHLWNVSVRDLYPNLLREWVVTAVLYSITMLFAKLSILLMYRRLFPVNTFLYAWWAVVLFTIGYSVGGAFSSLFQCRPMASAWSLTIASEYCISTEKFYITNAALNVISDLMILALPIPMVWTLNTNLRKKIILTLLFAMGSLSCIVSILRLRSIIILYRDGWTDVTWGLVDVVIWSQAELSAAMVCTCTPCLRPFFERYTPFLFSSQDNTYSRRYIRAEEWPKSGGAAKKQDATISPSNLESAGVSYVGTKDGIELDETKKQIFGVRAVAVSSDSRESIFSHR